ncbi:hypothetical protein QCA50_004676 [Cerrena zonata]|uniref:Uncharacterized protein n=1 Tax=Cerrena zonata TaxID=2478898 RepID=A0AAW0GCM2_9APHY
MRYLLDELMAYEEGFSDILMRGRAYHRHETFMGEGDPEANVTKQDLESFYLKIEDLVLRTPQKMASGNPTVTELNHLPALPALSLHSRESPPRQGARGIFLNHPVDDLGGNTTDIFGTPSTVTLMDGPTPSRSNPLESLSLQPDSTSPLSSPNLATMVEKNQLSLTQASQSQGPGRIPTTRTLEDVIRYWDHGDSKRGLEVPLKLWAVKFAPDQYRSEAQKLSMIQKVYDEFSVHCGGSMQVFDEKYPGLRGKYTKLLHSIRAARKARGDTKSRNRR